MQKVWIYLENGTFLEAKSFGATGTSVGEIVFNTSLTVLEEMFNNSGTDQYGNKEVPF